MDHLTSDSAGFIGAIIPEVRSFMKTFYRGKGSDLCIVLASMISFATGYIMHQGGE